jgi:hypothetical protein
VTEIVLVVEEPVHPVGKVHVKVYGDVPPLAVAVHVKGTPACWPVPQLTLLVTGCPVTFTVAEAEALLTLLVSFATTLMLREPFGEQVTDIVLVVEVPLHPVGRVQVNV